MDVNRQRNIVVLLSDPHETYAKYIHVKSYLCLSELRIKSPVTKVIQDNIFESLRNRFLLLFDFKFEKKIMNVK